MRASTRKQEGERHVQSITYAHLNNSAIHSYHLEAKLAILGTSVISEEMSVYMIQNTSFIQRHVAVTLN